MPTDDSTAMLERRHLPRHRTFLQGRVYFNGRRSSADCIIRELTEEGARLTFTDTVGLPHAFELHIPNRNHTYAVETVWNHGTEVGVSFSATHAEASLAPAAAAPAESLADRVIKLERELAALKRRISEIELKSS